MLRRVVTVVVVVALLIAPMLVRVVLESRAALEAARAATARMEIGAGLAAYDEAIRWSAPFHPYGARAREELLALIRSPNCSAEERRRGLEFLVSALETSRHAFSRFDSRREEILGDARTKLHELRGADTYAAELTTPPRVRYTFQILAQLFFWSWVILACHLAWRGFDQRAKPQWHVLKRRALPLGMAYALWLIALRLA